MPSERQARDALILEYAAWARGLARQFIRRERLRVDLADAISVAMVGLVEAATRFRPGDGKRFQSFASQRVVGAILDHCYWAGGSRRTAKFGGRRHHPPTVLRIEDIERRIADDRKDPFASAVRRETIRRILELPPREAAVIFAHYFGDRALADVGREMGISESRACQLAKAGIKRLRGGVEPDAEAK